MRHLRRFCLTKIAVVALLSLSLTVNPALAKSPVKIQKLNGQVDFSAPTGPRPFTLEGVASHLGAFTAYGEAEFVPGEEEGTLVGEGIVVFTAANGDLLVGVITWTVDENGNQGQIHTSWRDSVEFSDGEIVSSTGHFVKDRPAGFIISVEMLFIAVILVIG